MAFITAETRSSIVELAMGMLNQAPSTALLNTLIAKSVEGASIQDLADYLATTDAFTAEYPATQTAREFATEMFGKLITGGTLDAAINTAVIDLLEGLLIAGTTKAAGFVAVIDFLANPANALHPDLGDIAQSFQNRADAAEYFSITKELGGSTAAELAAAIASVTSDAATLTAANTAADGTASAEAVVAGQTFTLTAGADVAGKSQASSSTLAVDFRFTDGGNEIVEADIGTLGATDVFLDGSSDDSDVMNVTSNGNSGTFTANRIETINFNGAAGSPVLDMTNVNGTDSIVITGTVNSKIDALDAQTKLVDISTDGFTRNLNIDLLTTAGTTAAGTAETVNVSLSGAQIGTALTTTSVTIEAAAGATLETLNITSKGETANAFVLDASTNAAFGTVNLLGDQALTTAVAHGDVTGITIVGTEATGTQILRIDKSATTTTATNVNGFTGIDIIAMADSTTPGTGGDSASLTGLKSGQVIALGDDFNATTFTFSAVTGSSDTATIMLDNETASTDLDVASIDIQNIETLTLQSSGNVSTSTTAQNQIGNAAAGGAALTGDATTINITGDTSLAIDIDIDRTAANGARAVTVDASENTAFVNIIAEADTKVSYSITGTAGDDTLVLNATGGSLTGGAGDDVLTGGAGNDTIDGGDGDDNITVGVGEDTVTTGDGIDTIQLSTALEATTAVQGVSTFTGAATFGSGANALAVGDIFVFNINDTIYTYTAATTTVDTEGAAAVAALAGTIAAEQEVVLTYTLGTDSFVVTGEADGTAFTAEISSIDASVSATTLNAKTETVTAAANLGDQMDHTITDFSSTDVINTASTMAGGGGYYEGAVAGMTAATEYDFVVLTGAAYASNDAAGDAIAGVYTGTDTDNQFVVYLDSTLGHAVVMYDSNIHADTVDSLNQVIELTGITSLSSLAATFSTASFTAV